MHLEVKNLVKYYKKGSLIIKGLDFSIKKGEIISFIGESGSGKTTFLKCISGLEDINSGKIILNGVVLNSEKKFVEPQKRKVGFIFQDYALFPHLNLKENITLNLNSKHIKNLPYMLDLTGLNALVERYPHELSGGEQQRACIARALIREPEILLMDEPFSNLDSSIKRTIIDEIYNIIKKTNITTILVTHDINDSLSISDKILIFKSGVLQQFDEPVEMYCNPANCYCARILGDLNKIKIKEKDMYIRPENMTIVNKSKYKVIVKTCYYQGSNYKIKCSHGMETWYIFSKKYYKIKDEIFIDFKRDSLMYFDEECRNYFV